MNLDLQHDPRTKQQIKDALYEFLYAPVQKHYHQQLTSILTRNTLLNKSGHKSLVYKGELYSMENTPPPRKMNRLDPSLAPDMEAYLAAITRLNTQEVPYVLGYITQVLNASNSFQDYLRMFPKVLHGPIEQMIPNCPCRNDLMSESDVNGLVEKNKHSIDLLKQRVVTNLIL